MAAALRQQAPSAGLEGGGSARARPGGRGGGPLEERGPGQRCESARTTRATRRDGSWNWSTRARTRCVAPPLKVSSHLRRQGLVAARCGKVFLARRAMGTSRPGTNREWMDLLCASMARPRRLYRCSGAKPLSPESNRMWLRPYRPQWGRRLGARGSQGSRWLREVIAFTTISTQKTHARAGSSVMRARAQSLKSGAWPGKHARADSGTFCLE
mmetsp:Transcript_17596/g.58983  ORF Transcript_17596/g.58983 Transcript_17596/m.58983 type:complete len:213 (+) Transcript_17596:349-987(+)